MIEELVYALFAMQLGLIGLVIADIKQTAKVHSCQKKVERALIHMFPEIKDLLADNK